MIIFRIDGQSGCDDYQPWEDFVGVENFDESFVILGGRDFKSYENASWWEKAKEIINDIEQDTFPGKVFSYETYCKELNRKQRKAIIKAYEECRYSDDTDFIMTICQILYPDLKLDVRAIRGYCQGDYAKVIYKKESESSIKDLEAWYFGNVTDIQCEDDDDSCWGPVPDYQVWEWEREGKLKEKLLSLFGYPKDTECKIYQADGYIHTIKWKEVV